MKIGMINGSPKFKESCSGQMLVELASLITEEKEAITINVNSKKVEPDLLEEVYNCDALVLSFPLYVDGIPSHFLRFMEDLLHYIKLSDKKDIYIYAIVNCGFFEGKQAKLAIQMVENWCVKVDLQWGMGVGVGGGGIVSIKSIPLGKGPKKSLGAAFLTLANTLKNTGSAETIFINPNFPRFAYILAAHQGWNQEAKRNGMKKKELFKQL